MIFLVCFRPIEDPLRCRLFQMYSGINILSICRSERRRKAAKFLFLFLFFRDFVFLHVA